MTTDVKAEVKAGWSEVEEKVIAAFHESGMTRSNAVRKMRQLAAKGIAPEAMLDTKGHDEFPEMISFRDSYAKEIGSPSKAQVAKQDESIARVNAKAEAKRGKTERTSLSAQKWTAIDKVAAEAAREAGKSRVVTVYKSSLSEKFSQYIWFGLDGGEILSVNPSTMATRWLDPKSKSCKNWQRQLARSVKRDEKASIKADNEAAKAAQAKAK